MNLETAQTVWEREARAHGYNSIIIIEECGMIDRIFCKDDEDHTMSLENIDVSDAELIAEIWV